MRALFRTEALPALLLACLLTCQAAPLEDLGADPTAPAPTTSGTDIPPAPEPSDPPNVIDVQEQIYIITGVFITFTVFLLVVSLGTAYVVVGMRQTLKAVQSAEPVSKASKPRRAPSKRPGPGPARNNRGFAPDDDDDEEDFRPGDEVQSRGFDEYPTDHARNEPRGGRSHASPSRVSEPHSYDRFHQPVPDAHMPADRAARPRQDSNSRYGAGNLARLPKGPAPQPGGYDSGYPDDRGRGQW